MQTLGVIGGLGPMATALFMQMVIEMTKADTDQEHIEILVHNCPGIPDRTSYILGNSRDDPGRPMADIGKRLAKAGADVIAIPCITAGYFYRRLSREIPVPIINTIEETVHYLKERGIKSAGLMATDGTVCSGLFQQELYRRGIEAVLPKKQGQRDVMHLIYENVKAARPIEMNRFTRVSDELREAGAQVIILGCTELSMIKKEQKIGGGYLDAMQVLAKCSVEWCGTLKEEYQELITNRAKKQEIYNGKQCIIVS